MIFASLFLFMVMGTLSINNLSKVFSRLEKDSDTSELERWLFDPAGHKGRIFLIISIVWFIMISLFEFFKMSFSFTLSTMIAMTFVAILILIISNTLANKFWKFVNDVIVATCFILIFVLCITQVNAIGKIASAGYVGIYLIMVIASVLFVQVFELAVICLSTSSLVNYIVDSKRVGTYKMPFLIGIYVTPKALENFKIEFSDNKRKK